MHRKAVLESGPNCGKTAQKERLRRVRFPVVDEKATEVILGGGPLPQRDHLAFQYEVLARQLAAERAQAHLRGWRFHDRGIYCGIAYRLVHGWKVPDFLSNLQPCGYDVCFLLEPVPHWHADGVRWEDPSFTRAINPIFRRVYERFGVPVVDVPFGTIEQRHHRILTTLGLRSDLDREDCREAA